MANTVLSWCNWVFAYPQSDIIVTPGSGGEVLRIPQLSEVATLTNFSEPSGVSDFSIGWNAKDATDTSINVPIQVIGLLAIQGVENVDEIESVQIHVTDADDNPVYSAYAAIAALPTTGGFQPHIWLLLPEPMIASKIGFDIRTRGAGLANHTFSVGAIWAGPALSPDPGLLEGWSLDVVDPGEMGRSEGRQGYPGERFRYRRITGQYGDIPRSVAYGDPATPDVMDLQRLMYEIGTTGFCAFFPITFDAAGNAQDDHIIHRVGAYGHFASFGGLTKAGADEYTWGQFTFEELM